MNNRLLNINILDHPTNRHKVVFFYTDENHSSHFKTLLNEENISFEFQFDPEEEKYYFGIDRRYEQRSKHLNYLVFAKFRKPFIPSLTGKTLLIGLTLLSLILAIIGYLKAHS